MPRPRPEVEVVELGRVPYAEALDLQRRLAGAKRRGELRADLLLLVEHSPVVTLGRGARPSNLVVEKETLAARGVAVVEIERGGDVTYHGPGQLVGYPILDLGRFRRDLHWYLRRLEEAIILALARSGLDAFRVDGFTGVWVGGGGRAPAREASARLVASGAIRKIASIGVHASRWITRHGLALNVTDEPLESFRWIVPCGIDGVRMTSMRSEGARASLSDAGEALVAGFAEAFGARPVRRTAPPPAPPPEGREAGRAPRAGRRGAVPVPPDPAGT